MRRVSGVAAAVLLVLVLGFASNAAAAPAALPDCSGGAQSLSTGSYVLSGNQNAKANSDCWLISGNGITIDLQGFTVTGSGTSCSCAAFDVDLTHTSIVIRNGTIRNFPIGIALSGDSNVTIENMVVIQNGAGIQTTAGTTVRNSNVSQNTTVGIHGQGTFINNTVNGNGGNGIEAIGANNIVSGNNVSQNSVGIVSVDGGDMISGNLVSSNHSDGIQAGNSSTLAGNNANFNTGTGIVAGAGSSLTNNTANSNHDTGMSIACPANLNGNTALNNTTANVVFDTSAGKCGKGTANVFK
jgi:Periplasmic copper-binding protein (NosD)